LNLRRDWHDAFPLLGSDCSLPLGACGHTTGKLVASALIGGSAGARVVSTNEVKALGSGANREASARIFQPSTYRICLRLLCTPADFREFRIFDQDAGGLQLIEALFTVAEVFAQNLTIVFAGH
jgi:hypothetical protein